MSTRHRRQTRLPRQLAPLRGYITPFLLISHAYTEIYTGSSHVVSSQYLYFGLHGYNALVPWTWTSIALNVTAILMLVSRRFEDGPLWKSNLPLVMLIIGIWIEKGMGLIIPGFIPTPLGEIFEYRPSGIETMICLGIWAAGLLIITVLVKFATDVETGTIRAAGAPPVQPYGPLPDKH